VVSHFFKNLAIHIAVRASEARCTNIPVVVMDPATFFTELKRRKVNAMPLGEAHGFA
jgi:hypothetical protein